MSCTEMDASTLVPGSMTQHLGVSKRLCVFKVSATSHITLTNWSKWSIAGWQIMPGTNWELPSRRITLLDEGTAACLTSQHTWHDFVARSLRHYIKPISCRSSLSTVCSCLDIAACASLCLDSASAFARYPTASALEQPA